ncbi:MAG: hypothetical protein WBF33_05455 [Candidatus Nitrosopolaris sp.]|jgi:hypothetical protein
MSRITTKDKHQDNHTNTSNNTSDIIPSFTDDKNRSKLDAVTEEVKQDLRGLFGKTGKLIEKLGNAVKKVVKKEESICEEIKIRLKEEIAEGIISTRTIELHCPPEWKHRTKPKNEKTSFSEQVEQKPQQQIAVTQEGKSGILNKTSGNTEASDGVNHIHDPSKQDGISVDDNNEAHTSATNQGELVRYDDEPKAKTVSAGDSASQGAVHKLSSHPSDKQECSQCVEFTIPKEKYAMVRDAMDRSKASIFVKFDENRNFLRADPDVFDNSEQKMKIQIQSKDRTQARRREDNE